MNRSSRAAAASLALTASIALVGCAPSAAPAGEAEPTPAAVEVDEGLLTVDITIARSLLDSAGTMTDEQIVAAAAQNGILARVDGESVIYTMTKTQRDGMLGEMRASAQQSADELVADGSNSLTAVEFNDSMTEFRASVDAARFSPFESLLVLGFYLSGALYQQFAGVPADDIDVLVEFVDDQTGEVIESGTYQEMRANLEAE